MIYTFPLDASEIGFYDNKFREIDCKNSEIHGGDIIEYIAGNQLNCDLVDFNELNHSEKESMLMKYVTLNIPCLILSLHNEWMNILFNNKYSDKPKLQELKNELLKYLFSISLEIPIRNLGIPNEFPKVKFSEKLGYNCLSLFASDDIFKNVSKYNITDCVNIIDFYDNIIFEKMKPIDYIAYTQVWGKTHGLQDS